MAITTNLKGDQKAYVLNEKMPFITIFQLNRNTGELTQQYNVETLPANQYTDSGEYGSEIVLHPSENWLYASHRGTGSIIVYAILADGLLKRIQVDNIRISCFFFIFHIMFLIAKYRSIEFYNHFHTGSTNIGNMATALYTQQVRQTDVCSIAKEEPNRCLQN